MVIRIEKSWWRSVAKLINLSGPTSLPLKAVKNCSRPGEFTEQGFPGIQKIGEGG